MSITGLPERTPEQAATDRVGAVRRPDLDRRWRDRLGQAWQRGRERLLARWVSRRRAGRPGSGDPSDLSPESAEFWGPSERYTPSLLVPAIMIAVGSAALAVGSVWAWQTWSQRSSPPVDDRLPYIAEAAPTGIESVQTPAADPATADTIQGSTTADVGNDGAPAGGAAPAGAKPVEAESTSAPDGATPATIVVHVSGAVARPGVVSVAVGARVYEAVEAAGGAVEASDLDRLNLAAPLVDGERVHVPVVGEDAPPEVVPPQRPIPTTPPAGSTGSDSLLVVDLNRASAVQLQELPGVGPATADAIVRTRDERGPFRSVDELVEVPGIGDTRLEQLRPHVVVGPP